MYKVLINLLSENNNDNLIPIMKFRPEVIVFIFKNKREDIETFNEIKKFLEERMDGVKVVGEKIKGNSILVIEEIISKYKGQDSCVNLSGGSRVMGIIASKCAHKYGIDNITMDIDNGFMLRSDGKQSLKLDKELTDISIEDIIESTGGEILSENSFTIDILMKYGIVNYIINNTDIWHEFTRIFADRKTTISFSFLDKPLEMLIKWDRVKDDIKKILIDFMDRLDRTGLINIFYNTEKSMRFKFRNIGLKKYFLTSGSWLESVVYSAFKDVKNADDIKSGVFFMWDDDAKDIRNELDVMASIDSKLICISCKDTSRFDEDDLNELHVYSERLGGKNVVKILVSTSESYKGTTVHRAREMNIRLIQFDGNMDRLVKNLRKAIKK
ncbi:Card1-like endonuclease domain-containing protein [Sporosalibacterium faouarense]|uniref:Card1-like endonuclease domain-containing protein n=1 Tax=Sporosalibacterium faouarense TaxID=516123 RepID=UPI00192C0BEC|nr:DUF1887 family CARF protein [Sporosalibacterium faouarense]